MRAVSAQIEEHREPQPRAQDLLGPQRVHSSQLHRSVGPVGLRSLVLSGALFNRMARVQWHRCNTHTHARTHMHASPFIRRLVATLTKRCCSLLQNPQEARQASRVVDAAHLHAEGRHRPRGRCARACLRARVGACHPVLQSILRNGVLPYNVLARIMQIYVSCPT